MTTQLELNFMNAQGRNKKVTIRKPVSGLTVAEVLPVMETIVASDVFEREGQDLFVTPQNARYIRTEVEDIYEA